jgi:hypothetical protein
MLTMQEMDDLLQRMRYKTINYTFAAGGTPYQIAHGLNRVPRRWPVVKIDAEAVVYGTADEVYLNLTASAPCSVTLEVA